MALACEETFLYFAYGSNLLKKRIHINNPSAQFLGIGQLNDHQLDFITYSKNWGGSSATIVPLVGCHIWGAVWRLKNEDMPALDRQEGVDTNWYFPKTVDVFTPDGEIVQCRTYQQSELPAPSENFEDLPIDRRPSYTYLNCILDGAVECKLPIDYIEKLRKIPHNLNEASPEMIQRLEK